MLTKTSKQAPYGFHGGLCLDTSKRALRSDTGDNEIQELVPPMQLIIPLIDYNKNSLTPLVAVNDKVKRGQTLANGVVSPVSGTIQAIDQHTIIHPAPLQVAAAVITNDGLDTPYISATDSSLSAQEILNRFIAEPDDVLNNAALSGLGGAGFPTAVKIRAAHQGLQTLIINAAECEPEIACDEALMHRAAESIAYGIDALIKLTQCVDCVVAIEDSKPLAIERIGNALERTGSKARVLIIPTRYPTGAESPLIQTVTGKFIPHSERPVDHGVLCLNVATAHALWLAINGQALDSRIVSLGGAALPNPCNVRVRFGTPVSYVLEATGNEQSISDSRIRAGGPLSGYDLHTLNVPVTAKTNCLTAEPLTTDTQAQPCIRCGNCADVCPAHLLPQQLHWYAIAEEHDKCEQFNLDACIECGCCDLVCPAAIKLTETFRYAKSTANHLKEQHQKALDAEQRFKDREQRVHQREQARKEAIEERKKKLKSKQAPETLNISAALARARSKQQSRKK